MIILQVDINTIITNQEGEVEIELPYGEYTIIQKNTTEGYSKIEPFKVKVENDDDEVIELKDYRIKVPNTKSHKKSKIRLIFFILWKLLC